MSKITLTVEDCEPVSVRQTLERMEIRIMAKLDVVLAALARESNAQAAANSAIARELVDVQALLNQLANNPGEITSEQLQAVANQIGGNADVATANAEKLTASAAAIEAVLNPAAGSNPAGGVSFP